jgi:amidase
MHATAADPTSLTGLEISAAVRARELSAEEIIRAHLERIASLDRELGAFQVVAADGAVAEARALDARADVTALSLAGVPIAVKDNIDVASLPTRRGSAATAGSPATQDDELVRRLRAAGAVVIGKTRMPELAIWPFTESDAFGVTRNPWDRGSTPGGSTGGGAVAVASGMASLALGSDGGGSIRVPASCCGLVGIKPGPGVVPLGEGKLSHWLGLTQYGPIARSVADLALMLDVLSGGTRFRDPRLAGRGLRLAVSIRPPAAGAKVDPQVAAAVRSLAAVLGDAGHQVVAADPPYPMDLGLRFMRRWLPGIAEDAAGLDAERLESRTRSMAAVGRWVQRLGWAKPADADGLGARMRAWFAGYDALITPTLATPPVPLGRWRGKGWISTTFGVANWIFTTPWNLVGFPAASIPAGTNADGVPIGAQLVAPPGGEAVLLGLMAQVERSRPWPTWRSDAIIGT